MSKRTYEIGYIMPISDTDEYKMGHWDSVREILDDVVTDFKNKYHDIQVNCQIVSENADHQNIIQKNIVQNIYNSDLVICDVSSKNPNVMFELGIRLAFDKKIILIKDDETGYNFDTSPIKHLEYVKDLSYIEIKNFKELLLNEIVKNYTSDSEEGGYLKAFSDITVKAINDSEIGGADALNKIITKIDSLEDKVNNVMRINEKNVQTNIYKRIPKEDIDKSYITEIESNKDYKNTFFKSLKNSEFFIDKDITIEKKEE